MSKLSLLLFLMEILRVRGAVPYAGGCEEGWLSYGYFCYHWGVCQSSSGCSHQQSVQDCEDLGSHLASLWSREEKAFITDLLWQPSLSQDQFSWFGLHGTDTNHWAFPDTSDVILSNVTSTGGEPASKSRQCGALTGYGNLAYLPCDDTTQAFVCKKPLIRVFASSDMLNDTFPDLTFDPPAATVARGAQLFQRVWPPLMPHFLSSGDFLVHNDADSETGCAFRCYNVHGCRAFKVTCTASDMCKSVTCHFLID